MQKTFDLVWSSFNSTPNIYEKHEISSFPANTSEETIIHIQFHKKFPFENLDKLMEIMHQSPPIELWAILPSIKRTASNMINKFSNPNDPEASTWNNKCQNVLKQIENKENELETKYKKYKVF